MTAAGLFKHTQPASFDDIYTVLVLAPHPDDESLGCGGTICKLRQQHKTVFVIFITDGTMSHPNSKKYPPEKLAATRKTEAINALQELNVPQENVFFMNKKDRRLPAVDTDDFKATVAELYNLVDTCNPDLVLVPYEKDPHPDHRATWQMLMNRRRTLTQKFFIWEYLIWLYNMGEEEDLPEPGTLFLSVDITDCLAKKQAAIFKHISQTTRLIDDDEDGFMLVPDVLQHFNINNEYFLDRNL